MAIAPVNFTYGISDAGATSLAATAANHTTGNLIVVAIKHEGSSTTLSATDTAGNTYNPLTKISYASGDAWLQLFYAYNIAGNASNVVTAHFASARGYSHVMVGQYSGLSTASNPFDKENSGSGASGTALSTGNVDTTQADELIIAVSGEYDIVSYTPGTSFNERIDLYIDTGAASGELEDRIVSSTGTYNATSTQSASHAWGMVMATFKAAGGGTAYTLTTAVGSYALTGITTTFTRALHLVPATGAYVLSGIAAGLVKGYKIAITAGAYALTGVATTFTRALHLIPATGAYVLTGVAATLTRAMHLIPATGSYALTGVAATLTRALHLIPATGAYVLTGVASGLVKGYNLATTAGVYVLTGIAATLTKSGAIAYTLVTATGAYVLTGVATNLTKVLHLIPATGAYAITGVAATLTRALHLIPATGAYVLTGVATTFTRALHLTTTSGAYVLTGIAAVLSKSGGIAYTLTAATGSYIVTGVTTMGVWLKIVKSTPLPQLQQTRNIPPTLQE